MGDEDKALQRRAHCRDSEGARGWLMGSPPEGNRHVPILELVLSDAPSLGN